MHPFERRATPLILLLVAAAPTYPQSLRTDDNIETEAQLVSTAAEGTAPLAVTSSTRVANLNADLVDGMEAAAFAEEADLQSVEAMLVALQAQVDALGLALVPRTGQATCYDLSGLLTTCGTGIGSGQDGDLQLGVVWPNPRFAKNGDGTVTDNLTGLVWLENADCFGARNWEDALAAANGLFDGAASDPGGGDCGLSDGSIAGQWRLGNVRELHGLVHFGMNLPALSDTAGTGQWSEGDPFASVATPHNYWTSTSIAGTPQNAWQIYMGTGAAQPGPKANGYRVWPVRDVQ